MTLCSSSISLFSHVESILLVIAHPDDESMFFAPLLQFAADNHRRVSVLCLSTGNYDGLGQQRRLELLTACSLFGVTAEDVTVLDEALLQDGMQEQWPVEEVARVVLKFLVEQSPDMIATFDDYGVSGHPNHIAVSRGVVSATGCFNLERKRGGYSDVLSDDFEVGTVHQPLLACSGGKPLLGVVLESTNLWRKYLGVLDIGMSVLQARCDHEMVAVVNTQPWRVYLAMAAHYTQFVWYRRLFICFSRFTFINTFRIFHNSC